MPLSGALRVTYSMRSQAPYAKANWAYLYLNGERLGTDTVHYTYYNNGPGLVDVTGGRLVTLEASAGDHIELRAILKWVVVFSTLIFVLNLLQKCK